MDKNEFSKHYDLTPHGILSLRNGIITYMSR